MEKREYRTNDKGFSLIEMIIVIAIIAIMTAAAMAVIGIMHSAKAKEASHTFEVQLAELQASSRGQACVVGGTVQPDYQFTLVLHKHEGKYYLAKAYYDTTKGNRESDASYVYVNSENANGGLGISLSSYVVVKYTPKPPTGTGVEREIGERTTNGGPVYITFNRQGECIHGYGKYSFYKKSGNNKICDVQLNRIGSRQSN